MFKPWPYRLDFSAALRHRRVPSQARSRERVQRLLDTADALIGADGFGALTIPLLASSAHVPVGSIYQFFPDKVGHRRCCCRT